jgi:HK97 family phage portal protein
MAFWNRKQDKAENINYDRVMNALTQYFKGQAATIPQNDESYIRDGFFGNDHIYSIIRLLTRAASTLPIYLYEVKDEKSYRRYKNFQASDSPDYIKLKALKTKGLEQVEKHRILDVLKNPNPLQGQAEFTENVLGYKWLLGNAYIMGTGPTGGKLAGTVMEMNVLPSQHVSIKIGKSLEPIESYILKQGHIEIPIPPEQICHLKSWSPDYSGGGSHMYGVSPIRAGRSKIKIGNDATDTMIKMLQNMGMFGMFVLKDKDIELNEDKARLFERMFYKKQSQKGRTMFMGANFGWEKAGMSPVDLAIIEANKMSLRDSCNLYSISSQLLNDPENKTYNNMKEARKAMWTNGVLPDFNSYIDELNRWFVQPFNKIEGKNYALDYDMGAIPELQEDMEKTIAYVEKMHWAKVDEKRGMSGLDELGTELGESLLIPANLLQMSVDGKMPEISNEDLKNLFEAHIARGDY